MFLESIFFLRAQKTSLVEATGTPLEHPCPPLRSGVGGRRWSTPPPPQVRAEQKQLDEAASETSEKHLQKKNTCLQPTKV